MTSINQGYVRSFNLEENLNGEEAINNLGGGTIASDLAIFAGNTKNSSKLIYKPGETNYSITDNKIFSFDTLACYGNGDPLKMRMGRTISAMSYNIVQDTLTISFDQPHGITQNDIATIQTLRVYDTYFIDSTIIFNDKDFIITSITSSTTLVVQTGLKLQTDPGLYDPTADLITQRYPYAICNLFNLPSPLQYDKTYYVVLSNSIDTFQIAEQYVRGQLIVPITLSASVTSPLIFERPNEVTQEALLNLAIPVFQDENFNYNNDVLFRSFNQNFDLLESKLDATNYFKSKKYKQNVDNFFDENPLKIEGNVRSFDPDGFNNTTAKLYEPKSPGVYIVDPNASLSNPNVTSTRAFSDNSQPWELNQTTSTLEYEVLPGKAASTQEMSIGNLILKGNPISIQNVQGVIADSTNTSPTASTAFTHKLPVTINGEEYNLLLSLR